jgi:hypothetical protein
MNSEEKSLHADVLIHTDDALNESTAKDIMRKLNDLEGVAETHFTSDKNHLLMVRYTPHTVNASQLLALVKELGYKAQLVGL